MRNLSNVSLICPSNDLESKTILQIARRLGMDVRVSCQSWGARLENEPAENLEGLKGEVWIVEIPGPQIEDQLKLEGKKVTVIDHHFYKGMDRFKEKSSLEQFAEMCDYQLSEEAMGYSVNDRAYIWGLAEVCDSFSQMRDIRRKDLLAQGWTEEDFKNNETEYEEMKGRISQECTTPDSIFVHETSLQRASHLVDLFHMPDEANFDRYKRGGKEAIYPRQNILLIQTGERVRAAFSGRKHLRDLFLRHFLRLADDYWGGGEGLFGFAGMQIRQNQEGILKKEADAFLIKAGEETKPSPHWRLHNSPVERFTTFFLFPFAFKEKSDSQSGWTKVPIEFALPLVESQIEGNWSLQQNYSEYIYFHDYVRPFLFPRLTNGHTDPENSMEFYSYDMGTDAAIVELETISGKHLTAFVNGIYVHLYPDKIGILVIETSNTKDIKVANGSTDSLDGNGVRNGDDVLLFNSMFRRLYPAYFERSNLEQQVINQEFPKAVTIKKADGDVIGYCSSKQFKTTCLKAAYNKKQYPLFKSHISQILVSFLKSSEWYPVLDDRMLVHTYVAFPSFVEKRVERKQRDIFFSHLLYVDNPSTEFRYNEAFVRQMMKAQSYDRWKHYGTRIGFTRYSTAFQYYGFEDYLHRPFVSMYYQMFMLTTYYRAALVRFSDRIADVARKWHREGENAKSVSPRTRRELRNLHTDFMRFMNIHWFREVTNQDQGIEIFEHMVKAFDLETMYQQVKDEIERAEELDELLHSEKTETFNMQVGYVGISAASLAILTGFFGMNFYHIADENFGIGRYIWLLLSLGGLTLIAFPPLVFLYTKLYDRCRKRREGSMSGSKKKGANHA